MRKIRALPVTLSRLLSLALGLFALSASSARAQMETGNPLAGLADFKNFETRRVSSSDPDWHGGNNDFRVIPPGGSLTLAQIAGPGQIVHIWCTIAHSDPFYSRRITLRIYWDGESTPSVNCPIGDFFGVGHGVDKMFTSLPVRVTADGKGRNCYWPMPFHKFARLEVVNESDRPCDAFYYYIDWQKLPSLPATTGLFHAMYRQEFPCVMGRNYVIADLEGSGHYVGTVQSVYMTSPGWYGEGDDFFFIDGEQEPSLRGTGTEDYFCDGWGLREQSGPYYGAPLWEGSNTGDRGSAYRWHIPDPITFRKSLRVEIEHKGWETFPDGATTGFIERDDLMSSVAYWYQIEPHKEWPALPPGDDRLPFHDHVLLVGHQAVATARHSDAPLEIQELGGVTDGRQLWFRPTDGRQWVEVNFSLADSSEVDLSAKMVHSFDYGIYKVLLDGREIARLDLYNPNVTPATDRFGQQTLQAGSHTLRFEGAGKNAASTGYLLGFDALTARIPRYSRPSNVDLRTLQNP